MMMTQPLTPTRDPMTLAEAARRLAEIGLSQRAYRAAMMILAAQLEGRVLRNRDIAAATGWTPHNAARAVRDLERQAPGLLAPRDGYKAPLAFAAPTQGPAPAPMAGTDTGPVFASGPDPAPMAGTDAGPVFASGPDPAPNPGTDTGPNREFGTDSGPENTPTLSSFDRRGRGSEVNPHAREGDFSAPTPVSTTAEVPDAPRTATVIALPTQSQREATAAADEVVSVGDVRDRLAELGFRLPALIRPMTVQMIQNWRAWGCTPAQFELAIAVAHDANNGQRPTSPAYYTWAVRNVLHAEREAAAEPPQTPLTPPRTKKTPPGKATAGHQYGKTQTSRSVPHDDLHAKDYAAGATPYADLPSFLRGD